MTRELPVGRHVALEALQEPDLGWLYQLAHREPECWTWRLAGRTLSPAAFEEYVWTHSRANYTIRLKTNGRPVGFVQILNDEPRHRRADLAVLLDTEFAGIALEGVALAVDQAFLVLDLQNLVIETSADSQAAITSLAGQLTLPTVVLPEARYVQGRWVDLRTSVIGADAWAELRGTFEMLVDQQPNDIRLRIAAILEVGELAEHDSLRDLGVDSLLLLELATAVEEITGQPLPEELPATWETIADVLAAAQA